MAEISPVSDKNIESEEYTGPEKCDEKIASAAEEIITVPSDDVDENEVVQVDFLKACARCHKNFTETSQQPKLLPCLHSMCSACVQENENNGAGEAVFPRCPHCGLAYTVSTVLDNMFIQDLLGKDSKPEAADGEPTIHECTACEESAMGTSFCMDCTEWLCEQCVTAHRRVRVTKDHKIVPKEEAPTTETSKSSEVVFYCKQHKQEKLSFFCETCDTLTCRDCQLVEHKDHKYQFLDVASNNFKTSLKDHCVHMSDRSKKLRQVRSVVDNKLDQVKQQHAVIVKQVQDQADSLIKQIIQNARTLLQNVKVVCETMARKLAKESSDLVKILGKYEYCVQFIEDVMMKDGSNMSLLLSKPAVLKECGRIYGIPIEAQTVKSQFSVQYKHQADFLHNNLNRFGAIYVNGQRYHPQDKNNQNSNQSQQHHQQQQPQQHQQYQQQQQHQVPHQQMYGNASSAYNTSPPMTTAERQILMALKNVTGQTPSQQQIQSILQQKMQHQQRHQQQQNQSAVPTSVSKLVNQMRMTMPQANGWQQSQQIMRPELNQQVPLLRNQYPSNPPQQQQPFQPMRLQHRPAASQNLYNHAQNAQMSMAKMNTPLPATSRAPPPLIRSPNQSTTPPSNRSSPSTTAPPPASTASSNNTGLIPGVRVKQERRSSYENDCVITGAKVKGEKRSTESCSGSSPKTTPELGAAASGPSILTPPAPSVETEQSLEKVIDDLPTEDLPTMDDIDTSFFSGNALNRQLMPSAPVGGKPSHQSQGKNGSAGVYRNMSFADPNEDYCACCHNGGEVLCCDTCPKVFHLQCHIPLLNAVPSGKFVCTLCSTGENIRVNSPVPDDNTGNGNKRKAPTGLTDQEIKVCERIMLELFCHDKSVAFHEPVSKQVPNYYKIIQNPMDFTTIKCKLSRQHFNHYNGVQDFLADVKLVFQNCATYNQESSEVGTAGKTLQVFFEELVAKHLPHYLTLASTYPPRPSLQSYVESDGSSEPKRQKTTDDPVHIT